MVLVLHLVPALVKLATLMVVPFSVEHSDLDSLAQQATTVQLFAIAALGVFSTAAAGIVYFRLINRAGPGFVSLLNYLIPAWAVMAGALFLGEQPQNHHLYALALILGGILISQFRSTVGRLVANTGNN